MSTSQDPAPPHDDAKISLVVATLGRRIELDRLLDSLTRQTLPPHQVIIVDQNPFGWLDDLLAAYADRIPLLHLHSAKGASLGRNTGLACVTGNLVGFPDDDCWLQPDLIARIVAHFGARPGLAAACIPLSDETGQPIMLRWPANTTPITRANVWQTCLMAGLFARKSAFALTGTFDEQLGVGAATGLFSGEETDLLLRFLAKNLAAEFTPIKGLHHPPRPPIAALTPRASGYGRGFGYVWTRHRLSVAGFYYFCLRALGGQLFALLKGDRGAASFYAASLTGRLAGRRLALQQRA